MTRTFKTHTYQRSAGRKRLAGISRKIKYPVWLCYIMYCTECGKSIRDDSRFCTMCGAMMRGVSPQSPPGSRKKIINPVEYIEFVFILQSLRPPTSRYGILVRINHQLIFAAIPEYANAAKPEYVNVAESEINKGQPVVVYTDQHYRFGVLEIPKKILDKYRMMDSEQIQKETRVNFSVNSYDIKSVSYTLIAITSSVGFSPVGHDYLVMTALVPGNLSIEYGYKVAIVTGTETIVFIIRYEETILDRLAQLFGRILVKSSK
jgi:hypothetical protein